jgi:predicted nucleic acid-binding protein
MWIAACCLTYDLPLATHNLKDYEDFQSYHGLRILGTE